MKRFCVTWNQAKYINFIKERSCGKEEMMRESPIRWRIDVIISCKIIYYLYNNNKTWITLFHDIKNGISCVF